MELAIAAQRSEADLHAMFPIEAELELVRRRTKDSTGKPCRMVNIQMAQTCKPLSLR